MFPVRISLEQCTSEQVATFKANLVEGESAVDLTGGFGVDSFFLGKRFKRLDYVERNAELKTVVEENFGVLGGNVDTRFHVGDGVEWLANQNQVFDLIYLDPARRDDRGLKVSALEACEPDVIEHWSLLLERGREVMVKTSPGLDIERACKQITDVESVFVIAIGSDCKELVFRARKGVQGPALIRCIDLKEGGLESEFSYRLEEEKACEGSFGMPQRYLYEPNAALMKAGPFKLISKRTGCAALNPRSRLYTSNSLKADFPGRVFEILEDMPLSKKAAQKAFAAGKANVISRNCGLSAEELKRKLKLSDGGEEYAIGTRLANDARRVFRCRRLK